MSQQFTALGEHVMLSVSKHLKSYSIVVNLGQLVLSDVLLSRLRLVLGIGLGLGLG